MAHVNLKIISTHVLMTINNNIILNAPHHHKYLQHLIKIIVISINILRIMANFKIIHLTVKETSINIKILGKLMKYNLILILIASNKKTDHSGIIFVNNNHVLILIIGKFPRLKMNIKQIWEFSNIFLNHIKH